MAGEGADEFEGTLELGYQVGFPWSLGVGINFSYTTPNIAFDGLERAGVGLLDAVVGHRDAAAVPRCVDLG